MIKSQFNYCPLNDNDTCNHQRNIQNLIVSTLKIKTNLNTPALALYLKGYITRIILEIFKSKKKKTVKSLETLNYRSPQLWSIYPENVR